MALVYSCVRDVVFASHPKPDRRPSLSDRKRVNINISTLSETNGQTQRTEVSNEEDFY